MDKIAEDEKRLAELQEEENGNIEETVEEEQSDETGDDEQSADDGGKERQDEGGEEVTAEEGDSEEERTAEEKEPDARGYARLRREKAEAEKRAREYEERLKALEEKFSQPTQKQPENKDPEPDVKKDPVAWLEWNDRQNKTEITQLKETIQKEQKAKQEAELIEAAKSEFTQYEQQFANTVKDYEDVAQFMFKRVAESLQVVNPNMSQAELVNATQRHILQMAANYHAQGLNPAEELYYDAKDKFGFQPKPQEKQEPVKRDLSKVAQNRKRNAGTASVSGAGTKPQITKEMAANMSISEFAKLNKAELDALGI